MDALTKDFVNNAALIAIGIQSLENSNQNLIKTNAQLQQVLDQQIAALPVRVFDKLERVAWLVAPGAAGNTGATGDLAGDSQTFAGVNYASRTVSPKGPYANKYWYLPLGPLTARRFRQEGSFLFPSAPDAATSQCVETDFQKVDDIAGPCFNAGSQFNFAENMFRFWNRSGKDWVDTGIKMPRFAYATWVDFVFDFHYDDGFVYYDGYSINNIKLSFPATKFPAPLLGFKPHTNFGFQLDSPKVPKPYTVFIDRFKLTCWNG